MTDFGPTEPATPGKDPFIERTAKGLFSAPWLEMPTADGVAAVFQLSDSLVRMPARPEDLGSILGHLLAVHGHCQNAARSRDPRLCRQHYGEALRECEIVLSRLQQNNEGTLAALASWSLGARTLIEAQVTMTTDPAQARLLAYESLQQLSNIADPLCAGAEADAHSAMLLVREPADLEAELISLPDEIRAIAGEVEDRLDRKEGELNQSLTGVHQSHEHALALAVGWGTVSLALLAATAAACTRAAWTWSLAPAAALVLLWILTWSQPFRSGRRFFPYIRALRQEALDAFKSVARDLPMPPAEFWKTIDAVLEQGLKEHERLTAFYLFSLPAQYDTSWKARAIADGVKNRLHGDWMAELRDRAPWPLVEVLATEPTMIPLITRVWFGVSAH